MPSTEATPLSIADAQTVVSDAIGLAIDYGGVDDPQHLHWLVDQMVRTLTGCPATEVTATDEYGETYVDVHLGESKRYLDLVGPDWDTGISPHQPPPTAPGMGGH